MDHPDAPAVMQKVGEVTVSWNGVELVWYQLFDLLLFELPRDKKVALFRTQQTGAVQRDLVMAVAVPAFKSHPELIEELRRLNKRTREVSKLRNEVIHSDYCVQPASGLDDEADYEIILATYTHQKRSAGDLAGKNIAPGLDALLKEIDALANDLLSFRKRMQRPETGFLPDHLSGTPLSEIFQRAADQ